MEIMQITQEDIDEKNEYCSRKRLKTLMKRKTFTQIVSDDIIMFFSHVLGMAPYAWQFKVLKKYNEGDRKIICCTSRQIGKSIMLAGISLYRAAFNKGYSDRQSRKNRLHNTVEMIMSRGDEQAKTLLGEIKKMIYQADDYMENAYSTKAGKSIFGRSWLSTLLSKSRDGNNMQSIAFQSKLGNRAAISEGVEYNNLAKNLIKSMPPTEIVLGKTHTACYYDEASRIEELAYSEWGGPTLDAIGELEIITSTPNRPEGFFFTIMDPYDQYADHTHTRFMFDIEAIKIEDPEQYKKVMAKIENQLRDGKTNEVKRNYYCDFTSSDELYFPPDKIKNIFKEEIKQVTENRESTVFVGLDVGGMGKSHTVITVSTVPDHMGISRRIACWRYNVKEDGNIINDIKSSILPFFNVAGIVVDACPAATILIQNMKDLGWNIIEFAFTRTSKPDYMERFRSRLSRELSITYIDESLKKEFSGYTDEMKPIRGNTDDMIDSWMLSNVPFMENTSTFRSVIIDGGKPGEDNVDAEYLYHQDKEKNKHHYMGLATVI